MTTYSPVTRLNRSGSMLTELLVAMGLLSSLVAAAVPMSMKLLRVRQIHQQQLVAVEELSNQLERLSQHSAKELPMLASSINLPSYLEDQLLGASLSIELVPVDGDRFAKTDNADGHRLTLTLTWTDRLGNPPTELSLSAWHYSNSEEFER